MKYVCFILALVMLVSVSLMPALADDEEPAPEPEELQEPAGYPVFSFDEFQDEGEPTGEGQSEDLLSELAQLRANTDYIFLGVIALSGVVLGCFIGVTLIRMWGA